MNDLSPLETLFDQSQGRDLPLPTELAALYGPCRFPRPPGRAHVIANFVSTLDGVVALGMAGTSGGGEISGFNQHDKMVMGLLRAAADAVVVGAGTLRSVPDHLWTAERIFPRLTSVYQSLRIALGKAGPPLNVVVTEHGELDLGLRVFRSGEVPVLIVTSAEGARHLREHELPRWIHIAEAGSGASLSAASILAAVDRARPTGTVLVEGGPHLLGDFLAARRLDELFLTLAPQVAGRDGTVQRPGLVDGRIFAPAQPLWGTLVVVKRGGSHLFLRYAFETSNQA